MVLPQTEIMNFVVSYPYIPGVMYFEMYSYFYLLYMFVFSVLFVCSMLVMLNKSNRIKIKNHGTKREKYLQKNVHTLLRT